MEKTCPRAMNLWEQWIAYRATAQDWHERVTDRRYHYRIMPKEWVLGSLIAFFVEHRIYMDIVLTYDARTIVSVYYRKNSGTIVTNGRKKVTKPNEDPSDALLRGTQLCFRVLEKQLKASSARAKGVVAPDDDEVLHSHHHGHPTEDRP